MSKGMKGRTAKVQAALVCALLCGIGCGDDDGVRDASTSDHDSGSTEESGDRDASNPVPVDAGRDASEPPAMPDGSVPDASEPDSGTDGGTPDVDAGEPLSLGGLTVSVTSEDLESSFDLFGESGHRFWMDLSEEQLTKLNALGSSGGGGGGGGGEGCGGEIYCPGQSVGVSPGPAYADHVLVEDAVSEDVADYGKVALGLVSEGTYREWNDHSIPNVSVATSTYDEDKRIGSFEHIRFNNGILGSIFREHIAHEVYRALGYPALRSSYAFIGSNVWGDDVWVPMTLIEMYKRRFCHDNQALLGGDCENLWKFYGDLGAGNGGGGNGDGDGDGDGDVEPRPFADAPDGGLEPDTQSVPSDWCRESECDDSRLLELINVLQSTPLGAGFKDALADYIDWDRYHQFQCLSWIMNTADDPIHTSNNNLLIQRDDGKFVWAPYAIDRSTGLYDYPLALTGTNSIARGCQYDFECWGDAIAVCEDVIARFDDLNPEELVDEAVDTLTEHGMLRLGDEAEGERLRAWYVRRQTELAEELEQFRYLPDQDGNCPGDLQLCGDGGCGTAEQCETRVCDREYFFCESRNQCVYYEDYCPACPDQTPFYCEFAGECVEDEAACQGRCGGFYVWCEAYDECVPYWQVCPGGPDDDGGVPMSGGAGGGAGGAGGMIPIPID